VIVTTPFPLPDTEIERILVVTAHPDDADFGAAGTIASWTDAGIEVAYCVVTRGDAGGFDDTPRAEMPILREAEQRAAAAVVGVKDVTFLDHQDGQVVASRELRRDISREIRRFRPQRVLCQSPERNWQRIAASHPDHRAAGEAAVCAVYPDARNPFAHPELLADEGLADWIVREVWMMAAPAELNNHHVDVTDTADRKLAALRAHASQTSHMPDLEQMIRDWLAATAASAGLPEGRMAEVFHVISTG
jgi:LmbE family N-acetylglucosaminyl deacetylase